MGDDRPTPSKRGKILRTGNSQNISTMEAEDPAARRRQVDAHVQAFLKTVLDHANSKSLLKVSKPRVKKDTRDAATQTDGPNEAFDLSGQADCHWGQTLHNGSADSNSINLTAAKQGISEIENDCTFVPNRAMYSQETLQFVSQQDVYYNQMQAEVSSAPEPPQCYFTDGGPSTVAEPSETNKSNAISSSKVRRVISQWVEKYEQWFYQNFGVNVNAATVPVPSVSVAPVSLQPACTMAPFYTAPQLFNNMSSVEAQTQPTTVVSAAPVSYIVPEGSICMPDNHMFSPYVSLLPSFYTSSAFSHAVPTQYELASNPTQVCAAVPFVFSQSQAVPVATVPQLLLHQQQLTTPQPLMHLSTISTVNSSVAPMVSAPAPAVPADSCQQTATPIATSFSDLPAELQTSAMLAALSVPMLNGRQPSMGQWGPLLRYGTYGRLPSPNEIQQLPLQKASCETSTTIGLESNSTDTKSPDSPKDSSTSNKMPPPPPTFILLRRQAMICALQLSCRERGRELFLREKESTSGLSIDFVSELEQVVDKSINLKPIFLFTTLNNLPDSERTYFLKDIHKSATDRIGVGHNQPEVFFDPARMYACDLLIGDVLIAEACSTYKQQAQRCAARQAFKILSQPCFLVGSVRRWELVDYLVLCLSSKAELVPKLPPFLSDPFESLTKKDRVIDPSKPNESFEVVNPKPPEDFWLYLANLPIESLNSEPQMERILSQSAEFSQMTLAFEMEVNTETGLFMCCALIDNQRYPSVSASTVSEAQKSAVKELIKTLRLTQPIVGVVHSRSNSRWKPERLEPLWGVSERVLVDSLMWGKEERDLAIDIEQLEAHCDVPELDEESTPTECDGNPDPKRNNTTSVVDKFASPRHLENFVQAYAASALVTPLRLSSRTVPPIVWPLVRQIARNWGLLSCIEKQCLTDCTILCVLICKRAPLPRLKRTLYDRITYGCFTLLDKGNLSSDALKRLLAVDPLVYDDIAEPIPSENSHNSPDSSAHQFNFSLPQSFCTPDNDPYSEDPVTRLARHFIATGPKSHAVKNEPETAEQTQPFDDCILVTAELNQPSNAIEILDDLPRTLIPGIDF